ncbi:MAG: hypothetical protein EBR82_16315 [Caulobacteraceae bacterium]|nr:hypothetical protein [Caulobacteraceae bacterium]
MTERVLRQYVREVLNEELHTYGGNEELINTFISPFTDVFKTAMGKAKEISRSAQTIVSVAIRTILTTFIPFLGEDYKEVFDAEKKDMEKIRAEYKDVYDRNDEALKNSDAGMIAFFVAPELVLGYKGFKGGAKVGKELVSTVTGGRLDGTLDKIASKIGDAEKAIDDSGKKDASAEDIKRGLKGDSYYRVGRRLIERDEDEDSGDTKKKSKPDAYAKAFQSKKFQQLLHDDPEVSALREKVTKIYQGTLEEIYGKAVTVIKKAKTLEDVQKAMGGKKIPEYEKIKKLQGEEREKAEETLLKGVRDALKKFYIENLQKTVDEVKNVGIPDESPFIKDYKDTIAKIKAL